MKVKMFVREDVNAEKKEKKSKSKKSIQIDPWSFLSNECLVGFLLQFP